MAGGGGGGVGRGGHWLEVGPGGLLHEPVADGDLISGPPTRSGRGGSGGLDGGIRGGGEEVLEGGVGEGID